MKILIANRGEIAARIERTCLRLGHQVIPVVVDGDQFAIDAVVSPHVLVPSYLDGAAIVAACQATGADAVHPGFGFLAENASFAQAVMDAGITWIGPRPTVIDQMGSKINARAIAAAADLPLIPGFSDSQDDGELAAAAQAIGYPVLVKASAGGGGKGIRIAHSHDEFAPALAEARLEAERSFGDGSVIVERYVQRPRHIEVQVLGDSHGNVRHLGTRECSVQRRYQKLFEEAPAPNLSDATRSGLENGAVRLAASVGYDSAGTVEFIVDDETGDFYFLEMNTRLQVEHPVTEEVYGVDLVQLMIDVAVGQELSVAQADIRPRGHALEARITAEDASAGFLPAVGRITALDVPPDVRWESGIQVGTPITTDYDAMIAKLIVHGEDRADALERMRFATNHLIIAGVRTITGFHHWLVDQPEIVAGRVTTRFLDEMAMPEPPDARVRVAAAMFEFLERSAAPSTGSTGSTVWSQVADFSVTSHRSPRIIGLRDSNGELHEVALTAGELRTDLPVDGWLHVPGPTPLLAFSVNGHTQWFEHVERTELWAPSVGTRAGTGTALTAPFPAAVTEVHVAPGDRVGGDQVLVVIEAMKMLHSLTADGAGTVADVHVAVADQVSSNQVLVTFTEPSEEQES